MTFLIGFVIGVAVTIFLVWIYIDFDLARFKRQKFEDVTETTEEIKCYKCGTEKGMFRNLEENDWLCSDCDMELKGEQENES